MMTLTIITMIVDLRRERSKAGLVVSVIFEGLKIMYIINFIQKKKKKQNKKHAKASMRKTQIGNQLPGS